MSDPATLQFCAICQEEDHQQMVVCDNGHTLHPHCRVAYLDTTGTTCPICCEQMNIDDDIRSEGKNYLLFFF